MSTATSKTLEAVMLAAWTKASVDFVAPLVWSGNMAMTWNDKVLLVSAFVALLACVLWLAIMLRQSTNRALLLSQPILWTLAGVFLSAAQFPPTSVETLDGKVGGYTWTCAGLIWLAVEFGLLRPSVKTEAAIIGLWSISSIALVASAGRAPVPPAYKWTFVSSSVWAGIGCSCWGLNVMNGGTLLNGKSLSVEDRERRSEDPTTDRIELATTSTNTTSSSSTASSGGGDIDDRENP